MELENSCTEGCAVLEYQGLHQETDSPNAVAVFGFSRVQCALCCWDPLLLSFGFFVILLNGKHVIVVLLFLLGCWWWGPWGPSSLTGMDGRVSFTSLGHSLCSGFIACGNTSWINKVNAAFRGLRLMTRNVSRFCQSCAKKPLKNKLCFVLVLIKTQDRVQFFFFPRVYYSQ